MSRSVLKKIGRYTLVAALWILSGIMIFAIFPLYFYFRDPSHAVLRINYSDQFLMLASLCHSGDIAHDPLCVKVNQESTKLTSAFMCAFLKGFDEGGEVHKSQECQGIELDPSAFDEFAGKKYLIRFE